MADFGVVGRSVDRTDRSAHRRTSLAGVLRWAKHGWYARSEHPGGHACGAAGIRWRGVADAVPERWPGCAPRSVLACCRSCAGQGERFDAREGGWVAAARRWAAAGPGLFAYGAFLGGGETVLEARSDLDDALGLDAGCGEGHSTRSPSNCSRLEPPRSRHGSGRSGVIGRTRPTAPVRTMPPTT